MLRKLIMFAITSGLAKKLYDNYRRKSRCARPSRPRAGRTKAAPGAAPSDDSYPT